MKSLLTAVALAATSAAALAAPTFVGDVLVFKDPVATRTRADVRAETLAAAQRGQLRLGEVLRFDASAAPAKSRAEVRAELAEALASRKLHHGDVVHPNFN